jgi:NDP-mannose synthase
MKTAVILAGGKGTRLAPYTAVFPKPLVPVGEYPVVEILVRQLVKAGFQRLVFATGHLSELIRAYFYNHPLIESGVTFEWVKEDSPLGTAAPLRLVRDFPPNALVLNGDLFTTMDFASFFDEHIQGGAALTVASHTRTVNIGLGVLSRDGECVTGYREKPSFTFDVSMGIYGFSREALRHIPAGRKMDLPDLVTSLVESGENVRALFPKCRWLDIGNPDDYACAQREFEENSRIYLPAD